jgi:hypothetical protein
LILFHKDYIKLNTHFPVWARLGTFGHKLARIGTFGGKENEESKRENEKIVEGLAG